MGCRRLTGPAGTDREGLRGALVMAEAFTVRGLDVTQIQRGHEVLSTLDPELGRLIRDELTGHGVDVVLDTTVEQIEKTPEGLAVTGRQNGQPIARTADLVLVVVGVRPNTELLESAGATLGAGGAVVVDEHMRTGLPHVWAAGDGVTTHHRLLGAQLVGRRGTETAKRVDTYATALHAGLTVEQISDLDLSYTPPLGSPGTPYRSPRKHGHASTLDRRLRPTGKWCAAS